METTRGGAAVLERHLGYWLRRVSNQVSGAFAQALRAGWQTSVAEWVVLCEVAGRPGITPGEIAEALGLTRGAVSKVMDKLDGKGWVVSEGVEWDGRVQLVRLTEAGERALPELAAVADANDRAFFGGLEAGEQVELRRLLLKLVVANEIRDIPVE